MMVSPETLKDKIRMRVFQYISAKFSIILPLHNDIRVIVPWYEPPVPDRPQHIAAIQRIIDSLLIADLIDIF